MPTLDATPACLGKTAAARDAWTRATHGLPDDAPPRVLELAVQVALLIMKEGDYHFTDCPDDWKPVDWDRALRDTIKLRKENMAAIAGLLEIHAKGRRSATPTDPKHAGRASGVLQLVQGGANKTDAVN